MVFMSSDEFRKDELHQPIVYNKSTGPSLGVELEMFLIDPETGDISPRSDEVIDLLEAQGEDWAKHELFQGIVEIVTKKCENIDEVREDIAMKISKLKAVTDSLGIEIMGTGTHPKSNWVNQNITQKERYVDLVSRMGWPARQLLITGTHVHVGVDSGEKAVAIMNSLPCFIPHMLALAANSPYWIGKDTKLASMRLKVFEPMPTAGLPPRITNWAEFVRLMRTLMNAGAIKSIREIWWDVRPHPGFGTVEVRIMDNMATPTEIMAIVAFIQALVVYLGKRYDDGQPLPALSHWTLRENKWRAIRYGVDAELIRNESGALSSLKDHLFQDVFRAILPHAKELGTEKYFEIIEAMVDHGPGYARQRSFIKENGKDKKELVNYQIRAFHDDNPFGGKFSHLAPRNTNMNGGKVD